MAAKYETTKVAVDAVIFTVHDNKLKVLLHSREKEPYKGAKELYGGLILPDETAEDCLKRKLREIIGSEDIFFRQFFTFTKPNRDPRARTISIGFIALVSKDKIRDSSSWYEYGALPALAFDHKEIVEKAREHLRENASSLIAKPLMPRLFPLNRLQNVYGLIEEKAYDNRNFRKKMIISGIVEETKQMEEGVSHRPARLFRFSRQK